MSIYTGITRQTNDYNRYNMTVKERSVDLDDMEKEEAKGMILSVYDAESKEEILTKSGARAVFDGIWHRSVQLGDASLDGVWVSPEMRSEIQDELIAELYQEGLNMGFGKDKAEQYASEIYYGSSYNQWAVPLRDIVWSDQINWGPTQKYQQLNTTYVTGPDGMPWATGLQRGDFFTAVGAATGLPIGKGGALSGYYGGAQGEGQSKGASNVGNLPVDGLLNSIDPVMNVNTGLRALNRIDESWEIPTDEEIGKSIEDSIAKAVKNIKTPSNYGYKKGGGGGGGGSFTRLNPPPAGRIPYASDIPYLNSNSPYVRRAQIRRERFSSDRGRLKQWQ